MSEPNPIIERAARALFEYEPGPYGDCVGWAIEQDFGWRDQVDAVKLVLCAIREPSDAMLNAGLEVDHAQPDPSPLVVEVWQAMIEAALGEE